MFGKAIVGGFLIVAMAYCVVVAQADVFHMPPGMTSLEMVTVGNPGNAEDVRYVYPGYGAVGYTYNIGKYEVTAGQYTAFLNAVAKTDTYGLYNEYMDYDANPDHRGCNIKRTGDSGSYTYSIASDWYNRPVNYVSYWDASRFANWLHNGQPTGAQGAGTTETGAYTLTSDGMNNNTIVRNTDWKWAVTSEDEWYKAAYYKGGSTNAGYWNYPTSSDEAPYRSLADISGNNANCYGSQFPIDSGMYTTLVGEFQNSDSPYGTFDQGGNVWEWNESIYYSSSRMSRGGAFDDIPEIALIASARYGNSEPFYEYGSVGFRVVSVPEPSSLVILTGIALSALLYWWRGIETRT